LHDDRLNGMRLRLIGLGARSSDLCSIVRRTSRDLDRAIVLVDDAEEMPEVDNPLIHR
jgi:hypothetical protein